MDCTGFGSFALKPDITEAGLSEVLSVLRNSGFQYGLDWENRCLSFQYSGAFDITPIRFVSCFSQDFEAQFHTGNDELWKFCLKDGKFTGIRGKAVYEMTDILSDESIELLISALDHYKEIARDGESMNRIAYLKELISRRSPLFLFQS